MVALDRAAREPTAVAHRRRQRIARIASITTMQHVSARPRGSHRSGATGSAARPPASREGGDEGLLPRSRPITRAQPDLQLRGPQDSRTQVPGERVTDVVAGLGPRVHEVAATKQAPGPAPNTARFGAPEAARCAPHPAAQHPLDRYAHDEYSPRKPTSAAPAALTVRALRWYRFSREDRLSSSSRPVPIPPSTTRAHHQARPRVQPGSPARSSAGTAGRPARSRVPRRRTPRAPGHGRREPYVEPEIPEPDDRQEGAFGHANQLATGAAAASRPPPHRHYRENRLISCCGLAGRRRERGWPPAGSPDRDLRSGRIHDRHPLPARAGRTRCSSPR